MALQRSDARDSIKYRLGERTDLTDARLDNWLDEGLTELSTRIVIGNLETTNTTKAFTIGEATVSFPTTFVAITHIYNTTKGRPLHGPIEYHRLRDIALVSGEPRQWAARANTIHLDRLADSADSLDIAGQVRPTWSSADSDTPGVDAEYEYGIKLLATLHAARDLGHVVLERKIEDPRTGAGEFALWVSQNNFPIITQALAPPADGMTVNLSGYGIVE
jgi:hypothetical protein